jgi:tRNA1Val (adenine37-N6)-methyltransferase
VAEVSRLHLHQPPKRAGYRVNVDAFLLADFAGASKRVRHVIDLGCGVGAVGLSLLHAGRAERLTLVDIDSDLIALAARNIEENGLVHRAEIIHADVTKLRGPSADLVVCNPPYVEPGRGRAPSASVARAKQGSLAAFLDCARRVMGRRARACFVYPAIASAETRPLRPREARAAGAHRPRRMRRGQAGRSRGRAAADRDQLLSRSSAIAHAARTLR